MTQQTKHSVLGVGVDAIDYHSAVTQILKAAEQRQSMTVTALAVHGVMTGVLDRQHNFRLNQFDLVCPDGQPVRWALNLLHGTGLSDRVYGPELTLRICAEAEKRGVPIFLFGGTEQMLDRLVQRLSEQFPSLPIAGRRASRFRTLEVAERDELAAAINHSGAGVCFVGLGCPRQETFVYEMREHIRMPMIAVGAAFAFHAGLLPQAPAWMQRRGLEWLYRLIREPVRLWRRYMFLNPLFLALLASQRIGIYGGRTDRGHQPTGEVLFG
jgi:exopolysaccharide biosynthesis WecB/TagA/CpsF family protein